MDGSIFLGHVWIPDSVGLLLQDADTQMHVNNSVNNNMDAEQQIMLTLLSVVWDVMHLKCVYNNAETADKRRKAIIKDIFFFHLCSYFLVHKNMKSISIYRE